MQLVYMVFPVRLLLLHVAGAAHQSCSMGVLKGHGQAACQLLSLS